MDLVFSPNFNLCENFVLFWFFFFFNKKNGMATQLVVDVLVNQFFIFPLDTSHFSIQRITAETKLTHH